MTKAKAYLHFFTIEKETTKMTKNELELINLIRNSEQPEKTFEFALNLLSDFLSKHGASQYTTPANHQAKS